jgi:predicted nuclease of predicted toxin-antitoxin system
MKLLLDQGTPRSAASLLRKAGFEAVHTSESGLAAAEDAEIIRHALEEHRIVVTLDADFHTHLALTPAAKPSVIRIRVEGLRAEEFSRWSDMLLMNAPKIYRLER